MNRASGSTASLVVIGGSSGGLEALLMLLKQLDSSYGIPTIVVLHQRANRVSGVPAMLANHTHLSVLEPDDKQAIEYGTLYVAPPNYHLLVEREKVLSLTSDAPINYCRPAIDVTFETAARAYGSSLTVCVLSGANSDGANGARLVKQCGGKVFVQRAAEAQMAVMPDATAAAVVVDGEYSMAEMAAMLNSLDPRERTE